MSEVTVERGVTLGSGRMGWRVTCGERQFVGTEEMMAAHMGLLMQELGLTTTMLSAATRGMMAAQGLALEWAGENERLRGSLITIAFIADTERDRIDYKSLAAQVILRLRDEARMALSPRPYDEGEPLADLVADKEGDA